jgi:hypothetical protein
MLVADLGGPTMFARIGMMKALNRHVERVFDSSRKEKHWGKRKLARDRWCRKAAGMDRPSRLSNSKSCHVREAVAFVCQLTKSKGNSGVNADPAGGLTVVGPQWQNIQSRKSAISGSCTLTGKASLPVPTKRRLWNWLLKIAPPTA